VDEVHPVILGLDGRKGLVSGRRGGAHVPDIPGEPGIEGAVGEQAGTCTRRAAPRAFIPAKSAGPDRSITPETESVEMA
jgi:hypothetical protein